MLKPGDIATYIPDNPETDEAMALSGSHATVLQILRVQPEPLYDMLVIDGPFLGTRTTANETDLESF